MTSVAQTDAVSTSDTAVTDDFPYTQDETQDVADLLRPLVYFLGNDVRSEESSFRVAKDLLSQLCAAGIEVRVTDEGSEKLEQQRDPEYGDKEAKKALKEAQATEKSESTSSPEPSKTTTTSKTTSSSGSSS